MAAKIVFLLFAVLLQQTYAKLDKLPPTLSQLINREKETRTCSSGGQILCHDCQSSFLCIAIGPDYLETELEECPFGQTCKQGKGCVPAQENLKECPIDEKPTEKGFVCENIGMFPDLEDCQSFHFCPPLDKNENSLNVQDELHTREERMLIERITKQARIDKTKPIKNSIKHTCEQGYAYDPMSSMCSIKLEDGKCPSGRPQIKCNTVGQTDAISLGSSYFYVCHRSGAGPQSIVPRVYRCPHGELFFKGTCLERSDELEDKVRRMISLTV